MSTLVIVGGGFAGVWAALSAAARRGSDPRLEIVLVSRDPWLTIRPRLYEDDLRDTRVPLEEVLGPAGVRRVEGEVRQLIPEAHEIILTDGAVLRYDRMIFAAGSASGRAAIPGAEHAWGVDTYSDAMALHKHLEALPKRRGGEADRNAAIIVGGGFAGIEVATALASRLRRSAAGSGARDDMRIVVVERAPVLVPDLSDAARRHVERALMELGVEWRVAAPVAAIEPDGVRLSEGEWIATSTVVLTGGLRASPLATQFPGPHDALGRVSVDRFLRLHGVADVYAAGDVARVAADDRGHVAPMSCQCAIPMGQVAGANGAADLLGLPPTPFRYPHYVTCLDLGQAGALFLEGWDREVRLVGFWAKLLKEAINTRLIYPPRPGHPARPSSGLESAA